VESQEVNDGSGMMKKDELIRRRKERKVAYSGKIREQLIMALSDQNVQDAQEPTDAISDEKYASDGDRLQIEDLEKMKVKDLVLLCKTRGIKGYGGKKKDTLVGLLTK